ncbi:MAG: TetR/AcrR family transcriptional regulator [Mycolicibacterium sp.]|uniref:TetR/AcrR family transcriptional regulator n=1 Tax=Mycolicibacterium sp. TaxID=2320850 RepID=UPI000FA11846|nr:TetR/AcrR family transcriptional regulator [Mycolicibacterium sp.]RUP31507.1 MAG: TetR/AcrR family transcriptional regulator [Mycolicibacterium sp.]TXH23286.1 MAG: TetR/AcrR family transcriptional regulator [Mycobacterium sp.]
MPNGARKPPAESETVDDPRARILAAAERCITRYGLRKTTMEDIASEVGMSRPGVYRYFSDRDELLIELVFTHWRSIRDRVHKSIARKNNLADQIVEGLLQVSEQSRQDPVIRYVIDPEGSGLSQRIFTSRTFERLAAEFWDPFLDAAYVNNKLSRDIPRSDVYVWLSNLVMMLMRGIDETNDLSRQRSLLRHFVAPAFAAPND